MWSQGSRDEKEARDYEEELANTFYIYLDSCRSILFTKDETFLFSPFLSLRSRHKLHSFGSYIVPYYFSSMGFSQEKAFVYHKLALVFSDWQSTKET
jgi:hypothetical protein